MTKKYKLEVEVALEDADEGKAIQIAREHYRELGAAAEAPVDPRGHRWKKVAPEEWVQDAPAAIMELVDANHMFEKAGIQIVGVACADSKPEQSGRDESAGPITERSADPGLERTGGGDEVGLDEPETGMYLCRWPNGEFSLVRADTRRQALVLLTNGQALIRPSYTQWTSAWWTLN